MESEMFIQGLPKPPVELLKYDDVHEWNLEKITNNEYVFTRVY